ncbi:hypothetical protein JOF41_006207 [Saccharothrix coeruleofusca]|uniref:hypothetical protein n=1 Tax=Saccharothrix coeruleofusca TaxID=33919 RepID=UPI001AE1F0CA|nr:hypothetical protein [Saccharothrix coeruleofusca]MBP2340029.1 hypothetical protein [Saccharothrix coeruleofusca]
MGEVGTRAGTSPGVRAATAAGVCAVAYSYLVGLWLSRHDALPDAVVAIRDWVNRPTGLGEDFGFLGVALLLMACGYHVAEGSEADRRGLALRLLRGGVPLACAALAAALLVAVGARPLLDAEVIAPVAALVLFGVLEVALLPLLRRHPALALLVLLEAACALVLAGGAGLLPGLGLVAAYLPLPLLGRLARLGGTGRVTAPRGVVLGVAGLAVVAVADRVFPEVGGYWHALGAAIALLLFLIAVPRGASVEHVRPVRWLAERALPLALAVPVVGYAVLEELGSLVPAFVAVPAGVLAAGLAGEAVHRWAEGPA